MGYISILLLFFFISLGFSIFIIPRILLISFKKHLFDIPDERKVHHGVIPRLGGRFVFPGRNFYIGADDWPESNLRSGSIPVDNQ